MVQTGHQGEPPAAPGTDWGEPVQPKLSLLPSNLSQDPLYPNRTRPRPEESPLCGLLRRAGTPDTPAAAPLFIQTPELLRSPAPWRRRDLRRDRAAGSVRGQTACVGSITSPCSETAESARALEPVAFAGC